MSERQARGVSPHDRERFIECLVWLGRGQFIDSEFGDIFDDTAHAYLLAHKRASTADSRAVLVDMLVWLAEGDRFRYFGPDNPYGANIEFYCGDYSYMGEGSRAERAAKDMADYYEAGGQ